MCVELNWTKSKLARHLDFLKKCGHCKKNSRESLVILLHNMKVFFFSSYDRHGIRDSIFLSFSVYCFFSLLVEILIISHSQITCDVVYLFLIKHIHKTYQGIYWFCDFERPGHFSLSHLEPFPSRMLESWSEAKRNPELCTAWLPIWSVTLQMPTTTSKGGSVWAEESNGHQPPQRGKKSQGHLNSTPFSYIKNNILLLKCSISLCMYVCMYC